MSNQPQPVLSDRVRKSTNIFTSQLGNSLYKAGIHPDTITVFGLLIIIVACVFIYQGEFTLAGIILLLGLPFDALDGAVARAMQRKDKFGAVLDSTLDRFADGFIFGTLILYYSKQSQEIMAIVALLALLGAAGVSYVRARADAPDVLVVTKIGLFTRMERVVVIILMFLLAGILNQAILLNIGVIILAIGTLFTTLQRLWFVRRTLLERD